MRSLLRDGGSTVDVVMQIGDSNAIPSNNLIGELPTGYYTTDNNAFIWDTAGFGGTAGAIATLVPGAMENQPNGNPVTGTGVGGAGEFVKHYRADNPASPIYFFNYGQGNGRFSDASPRGRAANYVPTLTDGAYNGLKVEWKAFVRALAAIGKVPNRIGCRISMGGNPTFDNTETANFQSDMTGFLAALVNDGILLSSTKIVLERITLRQTGNTVANIPAIQTAIHNLALADPAHREVMSADGYGIETDNLHWTAAGFIAVGENFYYHCANLWYPQKEQSYNGGNPVTHEYRPGDLRNTAGATAFTTSGGNLQTAWDCAAGSINPTQATDANRPVVSVTNAPNGYPARYATSDGVNDILSANAAFLNTGTNCCFAAFSAGTSAGGRVIVGEARSSSVTPLLDFLRPDTPTGLDLMFFIRNDASTNLGPFTIASGAFNSVMNAVDVVDTGAQVTGYLNGVAGTPQSYTRGTITTDRFSLFGLMQNNAPGFWIAAKVGIIWFTAAVPDAVYRANAKAYRQRRWGTV